MSLNKNRYANRHLGRMNFDSIVRNYAKKYGNQKDTNAFEIQIKEIKLKYQFDKKRLKKAIRKLNEKILVNKQTARR